MISSLPRALLFGFLVWIVPFLFSFLIFPPKVSQPGLFESIMPVVVTACLIIPTVTAGFGHLKRKHSLQPG